MGHACSAAVRGNHSELVGNGILLGFIAMCVPIRMSSNGVGLAVRGYI